MTYHIDTALHVFKEALNGRTLDCELDNEILPKKFCEVITAVIMLAREKKEVTAKTIFDLTQDAELTKSFVRLYMMQALILEKFDERSVRKS